MLLQLEVICKLEYTLIRINKMFIKVILSDSYCNINKCYSKITNVFIFIFQLKFMQQTKYSFLLWIIFYRSFFNMKFMQQQTIHFFYKLFSNIYPVEYGGIWRNMAEYGIFHDLHSPKFILHDLHSSKFMTCIHDLHSSKFMTCIHPSS